MKRYCVNCEERILDVSCGRCLRCNQPFDPEQPGAFHTTSPWRRWRSWAPGLLVAVLLGYVGFHLAGAHAERSWPIFVALPLAIGLTMGLTMPASVGMGILLVPIALLCLVGILYWQVLGGMFCLLTIYVIFLPSAFAGLFIGAYLRFDRLRARVKRAAALLLIAAVPLVSAELLDPTAEIVIVRTERILRAPPEVVWGQLQFYEEIESEPPLLLRLGLPIPVRVQGSKASVGAIQECVYENGKGITKRITQRREARLLAFDVIEQRLGFEHDLTLLGGEFRLSPAAGGGTRLTLVTRYRARSYPGWLWRPLEAHVLHTLHRHIAGEIARRAEREHDPQRIATR